MKEEGKTQTSRKLKEIRQLKCLSQEKLAEISGISIRTIQRLEEGRTVGSGYTISALSKALEMDSTELLCPTELIPGKLYINTSNLKKLNLSAITAIFLPLTNIIFPAVLYWKYKDDQTVKDFGGLILSFQILWTLISFLILVILPGLFLLVFDPLKSGGIPLIVPVYIILSFINTWIIIQISIKIDKQLPFLKKVPKLL